MRSPAAPISARTSGGESRRARMARITTPGTTRRHKPPVLTIMCAFRNAGNIDADQWPRPCHSSRGNDRQGLSKAPQDGCAAGQVFHAPAVVAEPAQYSDSEILDCDQFLD